MTEAIVIFFARDLIYLLVAVGAVVFMTAIRQKKVELLKLGILSTGLAFLLSRLVKLMYFSPRPFVTDGVMPLIPHAADNGFPSDHALLGFTLAAIVYTYNRKLGVLMYCTAGAIGIARIVSGVHSPVDIIGSFAISLFAVIVAKNVLVKWKKNATLVIVSIAVASLLTAGFAFTFTRSANGDDQVHIPEMNDVIVDEPAAYFLKQRTFGSSENGRPIDGYEIGNGENCLLRVTARMEPLFFLLMKPTPWYKAAKILKCTTKIARE